MLDGDELFKKLIEKYNIPESQILTRAYLKNLPRIRKESYIPSLTSLFDSKIEIFQVSH